MSQYLKNTKDSLPCQFSYANNKKQTIFLHCQSNASNKLCFMVTLICRACPRDRLLFLFMGDILAKMSEDGITLTREGFEEISRELNELVSVKRPMIVNRIREARQLGDLSENFDYDDAKRSQGMLESRVNELKAIISHAIIVETLTNGCIGIGSRVIVKDLDEDIEDEYVIVGPAESSPANGKISLESCVGSALMGQRVGVVVEASAPGGVIRYEIISVA